MPAGPYFVRLSIPCDPRYAAMAGAFARQVARHPACEAAGAGTLTEAVDRAVAALVPPGPAQDEDGERLEVRFVPGTSPGIDLCVSGGAAPSGLERRLAGRTPVQDEPALGWLRRTCEEVSFAREGALDCCRLRFRTGR